MTEMNEKTMIVTKTNGEIIELNLKEFSESDTQKLNDIMIKNTIAKNK